MIKYGNKMIAAIGHYLIDSNGKRGFSLPIDEGVTFTEEELSGTVEKRPYNSACIGGVFNIKVTDHVKKTLISTIWSNDDQIAIILNRENGEDEAAMYDFMQGWREWFGSIAKKVNSI